MTGRRAALLLLALTCNGCMRSGYYLSRGDGRPAETSAAADLRLDGGSAADVAAQLDGPPKQEARPIDLARPLDGAPDRPATSPDLKLPDLKPLVDLRLADQAKGDACISSPELCDGKDNNCDGVIDDNCLPPWWSPGHDYRLRIRLTNPTSTARQAQPVFITGTQLLGSSPVLLKLRESSLRLVRWQGSVGYQQTTLALHDWDGAGALGDSDGDLDADDQILFLAEVPASGTADYYLYADDQDLTAVSQATVGLAASGTGFPRVSLDGVSQPASALRQTDGAVLYDLMLTDSIPFWNHTDYFTYESSALGPRLDNVRLPDGTSVFSTLNHTTGPQAGDLVHTLRLGPVRKDGAFQIASSENPYFQARLVAAVTHSQVRAFARPLAAVVVIDAELYCDEAKSCQPPKDYGDVRLIGYAFDRGSQTEVLMRWKVEAAMDGLHSIGPPSNATLTEEFTLAAYLVEGYTQAQMPALVDIDTVRLKDGAGVSSASFSTAAQEQRLCKDSPSWMLMSDTDAPLGGTLSLLPEAPLIIKGAPAAWKGCFYNDGPGTLELNGYQSEWHLLSPTFQTWGTSATDSISYSYWVYAYPPGNVDTVLADAAAAWVGAPLGVAVSLQPKSSVP